MIQTVHSKNVPTKINSQQKPSVASYRTLVGQSGETINIYVIMV